MFVEWIEDAARYLVFESIRDEALGDLWEADYKRKQNGVPKAVRLVRALWHFLLLVKASIIIFFSEKLISGSERYGYRYLEDRADSNYPLGGIELTPDDLKEIKGYCRTRNLYNSFLTRRLLKSFIKQDSYWIRQTERIIEKSHSKGDRIDCEAIVNSFVLSNLVRQVESVPPGDVDIQFLDKLVKETKLTDEFIDRYVKFDDKSYKRQLIFRTWSLAVYVISWRPGQESWAHHHGYALDVIKVIRGQMTHWYVSAENLENTIPFECFRHLKKRYEGPSQIFSTGDTVTVDRRQGHQVGNVSDENLVTLHFRFGHPPEDDHWRSTNDTEMFVWNQTEGCFDLVRRDGGCALTHQ
ncbi:MAG: hypothetical protein VKK04_22305 [Synechococcales bacterium]|nr:hypothetical protein [Synechococcales bacterium]